MIVGKKPVLDNLVKDRLKRWPQHPPGMQPELRSQVWLRGRPSVEKTLSHPYLKLPGSSHFKTIPDGLWLNFGGTPQDPYVDIFAVEACGTWPNFLDKRSRFAPSTHSLLAVLPLKWLLAPVAEYDQTPRWRAAGLFRVQPVTDAILPVREMRVLYGLKQHDYQGFVRSSPPHAHEFFIPMDMLIEEDKELNPRLRALVKRSSVASNFMNA